MLLRSENGGCGSSDWGCRVRQVLAVWWGDICKQLGASEGWILLVKLFGGVAAMLVAAITVFSYVSNEDNRRIERYFEQSRELESSLFSSRGRRRVQAIRSLAPFSRDPTFIDLPGVGRHHEVGQFSLSMLSALIEAGRVGSSNALKHGPSLDAHELANCRSSAATGLCPHDPGHRP